MLQKGRRMKRNELLPDPFLQFDHWYQEAKEKGEADAEAMALATANKQGQPSVRIVLYKGHDKKGFAIYTNYHSAKAQALAENPLAALVFYWPKSYRQVRIEGVVERLSHQDSEVYFQTRPRDSRLGAWASMQSKIIDSRDVLEDRFKIMEERFADGYIPCPEFWGGYRLIPKQIEFWQGQAARLHDRFRYTREGEGWEIVRLAP